MSDWRWNDWAMAFYIAITTLAWHDFGPWSCCSVQHDAHGKAVDQ